MQRTPNQDCQQQMKSEERQTSDERADANRGGVSIRAGIFETEMLEDAAGDPPTLKRHLVNDRYRGSARVTNPLATIRPSAITSPSIL